VREIDGLMAIQEQMIAKLTDYKQSVITEAVSKGLNPDAQLVPSGIDWIAVIPKGWKNVRFYYSNWIRGRLGWKGLKSEEYTESGYPFLSAFNIINNKLDWSDINYINQERYDESPEIKLKVGDILLVKDGAGIGKCARIDELPLGESTVNSSLAVITPKAFLNYKYLYYYLQSNSFWSIINLLLVGMGVPHLTQTNMKNIKMPLPPLEEQVVIAEYLDAKCGEIDRLIETKRQKIETLKEYKKCVIYEAVTGKTDLWDS
jgi:type I restriction enzyme S subunit